MLDLMQPVVAVHNITEKAGESIELTRLRREEARYETELTKHLAKLGNAVYEKISESRLDEVTEQLQITLHYIQAEIFLLLSPSQ
ncbi:MAG: hypothetical protein JSV31_22045 [Desulfobacterales bacterium]|nr:MAG: hypothetical protein JSV31_22045 [Desulfobacterales bacterium]